MDSSETYTHHPISLDPASKIVSAPPSSSDTLKRQIGALNALHQSMKNLQTPNQIPPPPMPVDPKRSANINKMKESAAAAHKKGNYAEAARLYSFAIDMAAARPYWEPVGLVREELALLFSNRAASHVGAQNWVEGWKDAESSIECKRFGNAKAWWRLGKCFQEMDRYPEAVEALTRGLEIEGQDNESGKELASLLATVKKELEARS